MAGWMCALAVAGQLASQWASRPAGSSKSIQSLHIVVGLANCKTAAVAHSGAAATAAGVRARRLAFCATLSANSSAENWPSGCPSAAANGARQSDKLTAASGPNGPGGAPGRTGALERLS